MEYNEDDEEINETIIKNKDILTEEELLEIIDVSPYEERIKNIIGRQYSHLFFDYFENIYHSKIKNKISSPITDILNKSNKKDNSLWMNIFKSIIYYSKENLPILIIKYFHLKAEKEFKFIYNISKKYTNSPNKFLDIYIKKMKKKNQKRLKEFKKKNFNENAFANQSKANFFLRSFMPKKTILRMQRLSLRNQFIQNGKENSDYDTKEEKINNKKKMRTKIMKQIRQLKIKTIKEIEKANYFQVKQKKKYVGIKSRFLDVFNNQHKILRIINSKSTQKINKNNLYENSHLSKYKDLKEEDDYFLYSQRKKSKNKSRLSSYYSRDNIFSNKKTKFYLDENNKAKKNNKYHYNNQNSLYQKNKNNIRNKVENNNRLNLIGNYKNYNSNFNKVTLFGLDLKQKINNGKEYNIFCPLNQIYKTNLLKKSGNFTNREIAKRPNISFHQKTVDPKSIINKLEQKKNEEFLENLTCPNNNKNFYNNKIYELIREIGCY